MMQCTSKSRYRGVYKCGKRWKAQLQSQGIQFYLGTFDSEEEAAKAYDRKAREEKGGKSQTNFDETGAETILCTTSYLSPTSPATPYSQLIDDLPKSESAEVLPPVVPDIGLQNQSRILWDRYWQVSQRLIFTQAASQKQEEVSGASGGPSDDSKSNHLQREILTLKIARDQLESALIRAVASTIGSSGQQLLPIGGPRAGMFSANLGNGVAIGSNGAYGLSLNPMSRPMFTGVNGSLGVANGVGYRGGVDKLIDSSTIVPDDDSLRSASTVLSGLYSGIGLNGHNSISAIGVPNGLGVQPNVGDNTIANGAVVDEKSRKRNREIDNTTVVTTQGEYGRNANANIAAAGGLLNGHQGTAPAVNYYPMPFYYSMNGYTGQPFANGNLPNGLGGGISGLTNGVAIPSTANGAAMGGFPPFGAFGQPTIAPGGTSSDLSAMGINSYAAPQSSNRVPIQQSQNLFQPAAMLARANLQPTTSTMSVVGPLPPVVTPIGSKSNTSGLSNGAAVVSISDTKSPIPKSPTESRSTQQQIRQPFEYLVQTASAMNPDGQSCV